jgi:hypothetical protein
LSLSAELSRYQPLSPFIIIASQHGPKQKLLIFGTFAVARPHPEALGVVTAGVALFRVSSF